jgi:uncharacterized membrane protein
MGAFIKKYFFAGLLVWLPIWATFLVLDFLLGILDSTLKYLPNEWQPDRLLGMHIPGLGVIVSLAIIMLTGLLVANLFGQRLILAAENLFLRIPLVRTVYSAVKQVTETIVSKQGESFRKVYLVQYPRVGLWSVAFQTGESYPGMTDAIGEPVVILFIPTTPNPTSGFLFMAPKKDLIPLNITVDEAFKMVVSLGVAKPTVKAP